MEAKIKEIRAQEERERKLKGVPGKGHQQGYDRFCKFCHREFYVEGVYKCTMCGKDTITYEVSKRIRLTTARIDWTTLRQKLKSTKKRKSERLSGAQSGKTGLKLRLCSTKKRAPTITSGTASNPAKKKTPKLILSCPRTTHNSGQWRLTSKSAMPG
jgi:hypothetical protein